MKKPVVDYRHFRLSKINQPEYRHIWLIAGWIWYLLMYVLTEHLIPESRCHVVHCHMDDIIPFNEYFVIFYVSWYVLIVGSLLYFFLYDIKSFKSLQIFIIITQVIAMTTYIVWPSVQYLRPDHFARDNFCTRLLGLIYSVDTPTGVCPSLHVGYSIGIASTWLKKKDATKLLKAGIVVLVILICMSVNFVKQHSFVDVVAALPMCLIAEILVFGKNYWAPKFRHSGSKRKKKCAED